jgi:hypothetical protein
LLAQIRQAITFSLAKLMQALIVDFLCLGTRLTVKLFGNLFTLFIVQSKGWPFTLTVWALLDFGLIYGPAPFASQWLYWQDFLAVFADVNPS